MIYLLDTRLVLWAAGEPDRLSASARGISTTSPPVMFSAPVIWEVAIKSSLGRTDFVADTRLLHRGLLESGYSELSSAAITRRLCGTSPDHHRDPFDRVQIAQARVEGLVLLTPDKVVTRYGDPVQSI